VVRRYAVPIKKVRDRRRGINNNVVIIRLHSMNGLVPGFHHHHLLLFLLLQHQSTTGKEFLSLVPIAHLLLHHGDNRGGNGTLALDNTIRIALNAHETGQALTMEMWVVVVVVVLVVVLVVEPLDP